MAEAEMVVGPASLERRRAVVGTGLLWLIRGWGARQVAGGDRAAPLPSLRTLPGREPVALAVVALPELDFDRQATATALRQVLAEWRAAERKLASIDIDGPDRAQARAEIAALQATHHRLFVELSRPGRGR